MIDVFIAFAFLAAIIVIAAVFFPTLDQAFRPTHVGAGTVTRVEHHPVAVPPSGSDAELPSAVANLRLATIRVVDIHLDEGGDASYEGQPPTLLSPFERLRCTYRIGRTGRRYVLSVEKLPTRPADP